jgi:hypothetical protein
MRIFCINTDYHGEHESPCPGSGAPMHNLESIYPDDIYSHDAARLYSAGRSDDSYAIHIIQSAKGRPNRSIQIFRAVPDVNYELQKKIKELNQIAGHYYHFKFFPPNNPIVAEIKSKYSIDDMTWNEQQEKIINDIEAMVDELDNQLAPRIKIQSGDWVALTRQYAKDHGDAELNGRYKILSKTVRAKDLYTNGDSIFEWGYYPS